jgi:seryl-tRNA synthetase
MPTYRVRLAQPFPAAHEHELRSRVFFVSDLISDFTLAGKDGQIHEIVVDAAAGTAEADIARKVNLLVGTYLHSLRTVPPREIWRSADRGPAVRGAAGRMAELGLLAEAGEGQYVLGQDVLDLMDFLDNELRMIVRQEFDAREYRYPTLIPAEVLRTGGYMSSFPQFLMFATRVHTDIENYIAFSESTARDDWRPADIVKYCQGADYCLPPTMCFHTYHQLRDSAVSDLVVTARGKSFRFESRYRSSLERLWDFTIREIVFLGDRDFVLDSRSRLMRRVFKFVSELDLAGHCEVASDPFFASETTAPQIVSQRMMELKYELRLPVEADRTISVGSFNFHERFFTDAFHIARDRGPAWTGCAGFGLERLTYAFLCQHGLDPARWPRYVRDNYARMPREK